MRKFHRNLTICFLLITWRESANHAGEISEIATKPFFGPRIDISFSNLILGSLSASLNFGLTDYFSMGPAVGFHFGYLFVPNNPIVSYDLGIDSTIFVFGTRFSSSFFINPYSYYSGFSGYRVEQPTIHLGFNLGYRWLTKYGFSIAAGLGVQSTYSFLTAYAYSPGGRIQLGSVESLVLISPSFKLALGIPI